MKDFTGKYKKIRSFLPIEVGGNTSSLSPHGRRIHLPSFPLLVGGDARGG